ncbi:MAG: response regulator [Pseudomonadota bacterium]|nr:response regulator [Pseudomonadota bacterium]
MKTTNHNCKVDQAELKQQAVTVPDVPNQKLVNILIVDDEPKNLMVLETVLDAKDYRLMRAASAKEALLELLTGEFAVLILDIQMPGISGFELAQMIKERKKTSQIPIIFLTAYYNEDQHVIEGYDVGAVDYLLKPINPAVLRSKVAVFVELYRKQREVERANLALRAEIAERGEIQNQLRELNETLEKRVLERTEAHRLAEDQIRLLMNEINHRAKNVLSVVMSVARYTVASSPKEFLGVFTNRIHALAINQDLLIRNGWKSIEARDLVRAQLSHFGDILGKRIVLDGPVLRISADAAQSIGMVVHELSTNAIKYGALSGSVGRVEIDWGLDEGRKNFTLNWLERDGPVVVPPLRRGFGSTVITRMMEAAVDGETSIEYAASGIVWRLTCPARKVLDHRQT